jgi:bis(5'-adenosyl)-triphosphatase
MSPEEVSDLFLSVHKIAPVLEHHYHAEALNIAIQDGRAAGQSVPHVHVHMLPRVPGDFERNDDIYTEIENQRLDRAFHPDAERRPQTLEEMSAEAFVLRKLFPGNEPLFEDEKE